MSVRSSRLRRALQVGFLLLATLILIGISLWQQDRSMRRDIAQQATLTAQAIDVESLRELSGAASDIDRPGYKSLKRQLMAVRSANPSYRFVYLMGKRPSGDIFFYADSEPPESEDCSPPGQDYPEATDDVHTVVDQRTTAVSGPATDRWGTWVTGMAPVQDHRTDETASDRPQEARREVALALGFLRTHGKQELLEEVGQRKGRFVKGSLYVFVTDLNAKVLAHPTRPELVGTSLLDWQDRVGGRYFGRDIVKVGRTKGEGWVDYLFVNPETGRLMPKATFVQREGDVLLCAGAYRPTGNLLAVLAIDVEASRWRWEILGRASPFIAMSLLAFVVLMTGVVISWRSHMPDKAGVRRLLRPVGALSIAFLALWWLLGARQYKQAMDERVADQQDLVREQFLADIEGQRQGLAAMALMIAHDPRLRNTLSGSDGERVQVDWRSAFRAAKSHSGITRLSFYDPDYRLVASIDDGDSVEDQLCIAAKRAQISRTDASATELAKDGSIFLHVVQPVVDGARLVGYVEVGKDLAGALERRNARVGPRIGIVLDKSRIVRSAWEKYSVSSSGRIVWSTFQSVAPYGRLDPTLEDVMLQSRDVVDDNLGQEEGRWTRKVRNSSWSLSSAAFRDSSGDEVGRVLVATDVSQELADFERMLALAGTGVVVVFSVFWALVYVLIRRADEAVVAKQSALEASEERLAATLRSIGDGVVVCDREGRVTSLNGVAETLMGYTLAEAIGRPLDEVFNIVDARLGGKATNPMHQVLQEGRVVELASHTVLVSRHGDRRHIADSCAPIRDNAYSLVGAVLVFRDISEEYAQRERLRESEERIRSLLGSMEDVVLLLDKNLVFVDYHSNNVDKLAAPPHVFIGRRYDSIGLSKDAELGIGQAVQKTLDSGHTTHAEYPITTPQGERWHELSATPYRNADGSVQGVTCVVRDKTDSYRASQELARQAEALRTANVTLERLANRDALTGLTNRRRFLEIVEESASKYVDGAEFFVLFLDLDNFKFVNDTLGHEGGDTLLREVASRLRRCIPEPNIVARLAGDEFAALCLAPADEGSAHSVAACIVDSVRQPMQVGDVQYTPSCSVGVASSAFGHSTDEILRNADTAMYFAKRSGKDAWRTFEPSMQDQVLARVELEADLRAAWEAREFQLLYQPIVDLQSGATVAVETLMRWHSPKRGWVPVEEFVALAEEINLIGLIGEWALEEACTRVKRWQTEWDGAESLRVTVNVSGKQVRRPAFADEVKNILGRSGLSPSDLTLEITETVLMTDVASNVDKLEKIRSFGVKIAIDDFGTGYSSMSTLSSLPVDTVKIDKSFISLLGMSVEAAAIVRAMLTLCVVLGRDVICEGIENTDQWVQVEALGCHRAQGYMFARPLTEEALKQWMSEGAFDSSRDFSQHAA